MKNTLIVSILLFATQSSFSQTSLSGPFKYPKQLQKHWHELSNLLYHQQNTAQKSTSIKERVIASSQYDSNGVLTDTVYLSYVDYNGSQFDYTLLGYNFFLNIYNGNPILEFPGSTNKMQIQSETAIHWVQDTSASPSLSEETYSSYDADNNLLGYIDLYHDTINNSDAKYSNTFNSDDNITASYRFSWNGHSWDGLGERYFSYNASKVLLQDSTYAKDGTGWLPANKNTYTCNASGDVIEVDNYNYTLSSWMLTAQYVNTYNTNHQLLTTVINIPGISSPVTADTFSYITGINYPVSWKEYINAPGFLTGAFYNTRHINSAGLVDTAYSSNLDAATKKWINTQKLVITFDSYNQPINVTAYKALGTFFDTTPFGITTYYYQTYNETSVKNITNSNQNNFTVYPNPTNDKLFISQLNSTTAKNLLISIVNATGQRILTESLPAISKTEEISIANFTPGTYWLMIQDQSGNMLHKQSIIKQ
ncbi:MAG TPA: T9SS type A sorting domain-containing protein [Flavipsychrobacter sp.]|nr:T9SS type A sorting domain-containing protein [Flavipsychrobacter sp.]